MSRPDAADFDSTPPPDVLEAWAKDCKCCPECSPVICGGVSAGGLCDEICSGGCGGSGDRDELAEDDDG